MKITTVGELKSWAAKWDDETAIVIDTQPLGSANYEWHLPVGFDPTESEIANGLEHTFVVLSIDQEIVGC